MCSARSFRRPIRSSDRRRARPFDRCLRLPRSALLRHLCGPRRTARSAIGCRLLCAINVLYGGASGIDATGNAEFSQSGAGGGVAEADDRFGAALATGDLSGSDHTDLAVGAPDEDVGSLTDAGALHVLYGGASGIDFTGNVQFSQASLGGDAAEAGDRFARALPLRPNTIVGRRLASAP
jgi:hypothetical protein